MYPLAVTTKDCESCIRGAISGIEIREAKISVVKKPTRRQAIFWKDELDRLTLVIVPAGRADKEATTAGATCIVTCRLARAVAMAAQCHLGLTRVIWQGLLGSACNVEGQLVSGGDLLKEY